MERFPVLRGISNLLRVLAVIVAIIGLIGGFGLGSQLGAPSLISMLAIWIVVAVGALGLWAAAELIAVLLAIEENTRQPEPQRDYRAIPSSPAARSTPRDTERPAWMR